MDVTAYTSGSATGAVTLGFVAEKVYAGGFRSGSARSLAAVKRFQAPFDKVLDQLGTATTFGFAAGRSLDTVGDALLFLAAHPAAVPRVADLRFEQDGASAWLLQCGIQSVDLAAKNGCEVVFQYSVTGGYWATERILTA